MDDIVQFKFSFYIPAEIWLNEHSQRFPGLHFNVSSLLLINSQRGNCLLQVKGPQLEEFWNYYRGHHDPNEYQEIFQDQTTIIMNVFIDNPWILQKILVDKLIIKFPITICNGVASIELVASRKKIKEIFQEPKWKEMSVSVRQIGQYCPEAVLSSKQTEILVHALKMGFFEIPRKINLSTLAAQLSLSPSALSENLRRITKKLGDNYLDCANANIPK